MTADQLREVHQTRPFATFSLQLAGGNEVQIPHPEFMMFMRDRRSIMVAMSGVDRRLELSARTLGAGPWRVFLTITVPLAYKGILAGLLLGFVRALGEFGATIVVAGNISGRTETLPLAVYSRILLGRDGDAFRLIGITIALAVVTLAAHNWLLARSGRREVIG